MSDSLDLDAIEARARAATGNTWRVVGRDYVCSGNQNVAQTLWALADAAHIAGMDPATTLALVARLRVLEAQLDAVQKDRDHWRELAGRLVAPRPGW